jgi:proline iminopeptidase
MRIEVNACRLYVDIVGSGLVADGPAMAERPVVFLLHGGPGFDHAIMKPDFDRLSDAAQLVYYDQRGHGRSDKDVPARWNLNQWADDLRGLIDGLGVDNPVVLGTSFGGFVAQNYAIRHSSRLHKLILVSTVARIELQLVLDAFQRFGGERARAAAQSFMAGPNRQNAIEYATHCLPLYRRTQPDPDAARRSVMALDVLGHFTNPGGENWTFDFRRRLSRIDCPTLLIAGGRDPITPIEAVRELAACIPPEHLQFEVHDDCGHGVVRDDPSVFELIEEFVAG